MKAFKSSRRGVLKLLGLAPAAPLAAKIEADANIAALTGVRLGQAPGISVPSEFATFTTAEVNKRNIAAADYISAFGCVPRHIEEAIRRRASAVYSLDPDIAAKRSWSMSVKILTQREREHARLLEGYRTQGKFARAQAAFKVATGWEWPF